MAFQAFRTAATTALRRSVARYLVQQPQLQGGFIFPATRCASMAAATSEARAPLWAMATRLASTAREVGREADSGLLSVLRSELKHEKEQYKPREDLTRGPPKPWTLTEKHGHADIILRRSFGAEDIALTCVYQPGEGPGKGEDSQDDYSDEDGSETAASISMTITITKVADGPTLEISAASYGSEVNIEHVYFWDEKETNKEVLYDGPNFVQLDEELQTQFEKFIKARGVKKDLVNYLFDLMADKEQREYMRWLEKVEAFLKH